MAKIVMKFGGTSVADIARIRNVALLVKREVDAGHEVAVVVSAMAGETNKLVAWTRDISRAHLLAKRLDAGTVTLNCQMIWDPALPFGGFKQSGWGYENAQDGIEGYMKSKTVFAQL